MRNRMPSARVIRMTVAKLGLPFSDSALYRFERDVAEFSFSMPGRPKIRAGHLINCITRFPVAGLWYVAEAQHVYDPSGLTTRLTCNASNRRRTP